MEEVGELRRPTPSYLFPGGEVVIEARQGIGKRKKIDANSRENPLYISLQQPPLYFPQNRQL